MLTCDVCGHEMESLTCGECGAENLPNARFCSFCGRQFPEETPAEKKSKKKSRDDPYDLENRILCSDDTCIGIINEQGVCTECGRPYKKTD